MRIFFAFLIATFVVSAHATPCPGKSVCLEATGLFPVPGDCTSFYNCYRCHPRITRCATGTSFDATKGYCNYHHAFQCGDQGHGSQGSVGGLPEQNQGGYRPGGQYPLGQVQRPYQSAQTEDKNPPVQIQEQAEPAQTQASLRPGQTHEQYPTGQTQGQYKPRPTQGQYKPRPTQGQHQSGLDYGQYSPGQTQVPYQTGQPHQSGQPHDTGIQSTGKDQADPGSQFSTPAPSEHQGYVEKGPKSRFYETHISHHPELEKYGDTHQVVFDHSHTVHHINGVTASTNGGLKNYGERVFGKARDDANSGKTGSRPQIEIELEDGTLAEPEEFYTDDELDGNGSLMTYQRKDQQAEVTPGVQRRDPDTGSRGHTHYPTGSGYRMKMLANYPARVGK